MGNLFGKFSRLFWKKEARIIMLGLDAAGKTSILYQLQLGHLVQTIPTTGFNVKTVEYNNISFTIWDVGYREKLEPLWHRYFENTQAIIFVIDCSDRERIHEAKDALMSICSSEFYYIPVSSAADKLRDACFLILANKQDLPGAMNEIELTDTLGLNFIKGRKWHVQPTSAIKGDGLYEGLDWLSNQLNNN